MTTFYVSSDHAVAAMAASRGWRRVAEPREARLVILDQASSSSSSSLIDGDAAAWVWAADCAALSDKALFFDRCLACASRRGSTAEASHMPQTWVVRRGAERALPTVEDKGIVGYYVKHPRCGGGAGTVFAATAAAARRAAGAMLETTSIDAVVVQRAVEPATLPRGPSIFELRVWAVVRRRRCWIFSRHRAKTARGGLMNKRVQREKRDYGAFYAFNMATHDEVREAVGAAVYDARTEPGIRAAVRLAHEATRAALRPGAFYFVGFDFIVDGDGDPWLIEANVKPSWRYDTCDAAQFPSPIVRDLALAALRDLPRLLVDEKKRPDPDTAPGPRWEHLGGYDDGDDADDPAA